MAARLAEMLRFHRRDRTATPFVALDRSRCEACWNCIAVCPESVMRRLEFGRHKHAVVSAGDRCTGCRRCVKACPAGALSDQAVRPLSPAE